MKMLLSLFILMTVHTAAGSDKHILYAGGLFELTNHWYVDYVNFFINIIEQVFEEIGNRTDILKGYSLKLIYKDTQVNRLQFLQSEVCCMIIIENN